MSKRRVGKFVLAEMQGVEKNWHKVEGVEITWTVNLETVLTSKNAVRSGVCRRGWWYYDGGIRTMEDITPLRRDED